MTYVTMNGNLVAGSDHVTIDVADGDLTLIVDRIGIIQDDVSHYTKFVNQLASTKETVEVYVFREGLMLSGKCVVETSGAGLIARGRITSDWQ